MEQYLELFSKIFGGLSGVGFLVGIVIIWKTGLLEFLLNWKKNGGKQNDLAKKVCDLEEHAKVANEEMAKVKEGMAALNTKMDIILRYLKI